MRRRLAKPLRIAALALAASLVLAASLLALALFTPWGARWVLTVILPPEISFTRLEGSLAFGLEIEEAAYHGDAVHARLDALQVRPALGPLLHDALQLATFHGHNGSVTLSGGRNAASGEPPTLPAVPASFGLRDIELEDIDVRGVGAAPVTLRRVKGRLEGPRLSLASVTAEVSGARLDFSADLDLSEPANGSLDGKLTWRAAAAAQGGAPAVPPESLSFAANLQLVTDELPWRAIVTWSRLSWQSASAGSWRSPRGTLSITPGTVPIGARLAAELQSDALPTPASLSARAELAGTTLELKRLDVQVLGGSIESRGSVELSGGLSGHLDLDYRNLDPSLVENRLEGRLRGHIGLTAATAPSLRVSVDGRLGGELGGRALNGLVTASYSGGTGTLQIEQASLRLDDGRLSAAGTVASTGSRIEFSAEIPRIEDWYPAAAGSLTASGTVQGTTDNPRIDVQLEAQDLAAESIAIPPLTQLTVNVQGRLDDHAVSVRSSSDLGGFDFDLEEGWTGGRMQGVLAHSELRTARAGNWTLSAPARYSLGREQLRLDRACYAGEDGGELCLDAADQTAHLVAHALPSALAEPWLAQDIRVSGRAEGRAELSWEPQLTGSLSFTQPSLTVSRRSETGTVQLTEILDLRLQGTLSGNALHMDLASHFRHDGDKLRGHLALAPVSSTGALSGELNASLSDLSVISAFLPEIDEVAGEANADLAVAGSPASPSLQGELTLDSVGARILPLSVRVSKGRLTLTANGPEDVAFQGTLCSGGCIRLNGDLRLPGQQPWRLAARIEGEQFQLADLPDVQVTATPDLSIEADPAQWRVTGALGMPSGRFVFENLPRSTIQPAAETVVHGAPAEPQQQPLPIPLVVDVDADLGNVRFEGLGVKATLQGMLRVERNAAGQLLVEGTTTISQGSFEAYGQQLTIEQGQLIFIGPPDNPSLDIRAVRQVADAQVGLNITGTARDPRSEIFSDPPMSESEALARLVTGRSLQSAGPADAEALQRAAIGLGLKRALPALSRIGNTLGLSELGVESPGQSQGAIVAGKQVSRDVYLRYKYGLFDNFAGFELIYQITRRFQLRTETGTTQAIDFVYQVNPRGGSGGNRATSPGAPPTPEPTTPEQEVSKQSAR